MNKKVAMQPAKFTDPINIVPLSTLTTLDHTSILLCRFNKALT